MVLILKLLYCLIYAATIAYSTPLVDDTIGGSNETGHVDVYENINSACVDRGIDCHHVFGRGQYCCRDAKGEFQCCYSNNNMQPKFKSSPAETHWFHRFSLWNMWYFWFIVVLVMATCFTGCNYWRRQRQLFNVRLFQRQYSAIGNGNRRNNAAQIVIPVTMYEVSPDAILQFMRENSRQHGTSTSTHLYQQANRRQHAPPSYTEVTAKPNLYPPNASDDLNAQPPSYESALRSLIKNGSNSQDAGGDQAQQRRLSL